MRVSGRGRGRGRGGGGGRARFGGRPAHVDAALELGVEDEAARLEQRHAAAERVAVHVARLVAPVAEQPRLHLLHQPRARGVVVEEDARVLAAVQLDGVLRVGAQRLQSRTLQLLLLGLQQVRVRVRVRARGQGHG